MICKKMENLMEDSIKDDLAGAGFVSLMLTPFPIWFPIYWISRFWNAKGD